MKDLTGKVIDMLEDSNLEAVKVHLCALFLLAMLYSSKARGTLQTFLHAF